VLQPSVRFPYCRFETLPSRSGLQTWAKTVGRRPPFSLNRMLGHYALPLPLYPRQTGHAVLFHFGEDLQGRVVGPHASLHEVRLTSSHNPPLCSQIARVGGLIPAPDTARHRAGALSRAAKAEYCQRCAGTSHDATKAAIRPISLGSAKNGAWP
jgi:hypothetical protein